MKIEKEKKYKYQIFFLRIITVSMLICFFGVGIAFFGYYDIGYYIGLYAGIIFILAMLCYYIALFNRRD